MWINFHQYAHLLKQDVADCFITLQVTAPGKIVWIGTYLLPPQNEIVGEILGYNASFLEELYKKLLEIKRKYKALQSKNIENALIEPKIKGVIAYNRWYGNESVTVIVNLNDKPVTCYLKTRFKEMKVYDILSGEEFYGNPKKLVIKVPAYTSRLLVS